MSTPAPTVLRTLRSARRKISNLKNWSAGALALKKRMRNKCAEEVEVDPWAAGANCFCAVGAVAAVMPKPKQGLDLETVAYRLVRGSEAGLLLAHVIAGLEEGDYPQWLDNYRSGRPIVHSTDVDNRIFDFNDSGKRGPKEHAAVLHAFDLAILHAKHAGI